MSIGYSSSTVALNKKADKTRLGVALGRLSIELGIPVAEIAERLRVSRQTVYNWFVGINDPSKDVTKEVIKLLETFEDVKLAKRNK